MAGRAADPVAAGLEGQAAASAGRVAAGLEGQAAASSGRAEEEGDQADAEAEDNKAAERREWGGCGARSA